jgi:hypothetical protein
MSSGPLIFTVLLSLLILPAHAQLLKPIDWNKASDYQQKEFGTKGYAGSNYDTKQFQQPEQVQTKTYRTHEFSQSSKDFQVHFAPISGNQVATPEIVAKSPEYVNKKVETRSYQTKEARGAPLAHQIADKPTINWQTLVRKTPP